MNWITPNVQKAIALAFVFSWYLAQGRFSLFWQALSGQVQINSSGGGSTEIPGAPGGGGSGGGNGGLIA